MENLKCWGKRLLKYGLIGLALIIGIKIIAGNIAASKKPVQAAMVVTDSSRRYAAAHNWSKDNREFFSKEVTIPDGSQGWVSIAAPPYYRVETSRTFDIEYDLSDGRIVKEGPNLPRQELGNFPATFDVRATSKGGTLRILFHRNPIPEKKGEVTALSKKSRFVKTVHREEKDVPHSVQRM